MCESVVTIAPTLTALNIRQYIRLDKNTYRDIFVDERLLRGGIERQKKERAEISNSLESRPLLPRCAISLCDVGPEVNA